MIENAGCGLWFAPGLFSLPCISIEKKKFKNK